MSETSKPLFDFLESWKPFAQMGPGNPARRGLTRFLQADSTEKRFQVLARSNPLYKLHTIYDQLGIKKTETHEKSDRLRSLLVMPIKEMEEMIADGIPRELLFSFQMIFEFGRFEQEPQMNAVRKFLLDFWEMEPKGFGLKFTIYPSGILFSGSGQSHDELAHAFNKLGLSGKPTGGGELQRKSTFVFQYDLASTAFSGQATPDLVDKSLRRWIRLTGGDSEPLKLNYQKKLPMP